LKPALYPSAMFEEPEVLPYRASTPEAAL
jgi:hypothetical protein